MTFNTVHCRCVQISFHLPIFLDDSTLEGLFLSSDKDKIRGRGGNFISTQMKSRNLVIDLERKCCCCSKIHDVFGEELKLFTISTFRADICCGNMIHSSMGRRYEECFACMRKRIARCLLHRWGKQQLPVASWRTTHSLPLNSKKKLGSSCAHSGVPAPDISNRWVESSSELTF